MSTKLYYNIYTIHSIQTHAHTYITYILIRCCVCISGYERLHKFKLKIWGKNKTLVNILGKNSNLELGKKVADTILDKTKRTFKNGKVSGILSILVLFHCVV